MKNNYIRKDEPVKCIPFWVYLMAVMCGLILAAHYMGWICVTSVNPLT